MLDGGQLSPEGALFLHAKADLLGLARMATAGAERLNPDAVVTYIVDRNLNPPTSASPTAGSARSTARRATARPTC
ncbi:MAG: hypothetical protein R3E96_05440 [Planctomycetota bacterium]